MGLSEADSGNSNISKFSLLDHIRARGTRKMRLKAAMTASSPRILKKLSKDYPPEILEAVAKNPHTSDEVLASLLPTSFKDVILARSDIKTRLEIAKDPNLSQEVFGKLAQDLIYEIRIAIARNINCPEKIIEKLAMDPVDSVRTTAEGHPKIQEIADQAKYTQDEEKIILLSRSPIQLIQESISKNPVIKQILTDNKDKIWSNIKPLESLMARIAETTTSVDVIKIIFESKVGFKGIAKNENTPIEILRELFLSQVQEVNKILAKNPNTPYDVLVELYKLNFTDEVCQNPSILNLAQTARTTDSKKLLEILSKEIIYIIRAAVASNQNTPLYILIKLADGYTRETSIATINNIIKNITDPDKLTNLANYDNGYVVTAVAQNITTPSKVLAKLSGNPSVSVRKAVAENPNTTEDILSKLANENNKDEVWKSVAKNPKIVKLNELAQSTQDPIILSVLSNQPFACVRTEVAKNIKCVKGLLIKLLEDPRWLVRIAAAKNPNTPAHHIAFLLNRLPKDSVQVVTETYTVNEWVSGCHDGDTYADVEHYVYGEKIGYIGKSLETAREILKIHQNDETVIMEILKNLNNELYEALTKK